MVLSNFVKKNLLPLFGLQQQSGYVVKDFCVFFLGVPKVYHLSSLEEFISIFFTWFRYKCLRNLIFNFHLELP